jgi:hypothetical protein
MPCIDFRKDMVDRAAKIGELLLEILGGLHRNRRPINCSGTGDGGHIASPLLESAEDIFDRHNGHTLRGQELLT